MQDSNSEPNQVWKFFRLAKSHWNQGIRSSQQLYIHNLKCQDKEWSNLDMTWLLHFLTNLHIIDA
jgi:hypothetical protein